jgi:mono/diheme cytochrome c family protein
MNRLFTSFLYTAFVLFLVSCGGDSKEISEKSDRSVQYFPNMYESVGYETYQEGAIFPGNVEAQKPVDGTVSRGWMPYDYADSNDGYASAKAELTNPIPYTEEHLTNGAALYNVYCAICHGTKGDGKGHLVTTEKILGVPSYDSRELTQGSIYHVMYYGINYMGSYASQTSIEERWQIAHHVDALTNDLKGLPRKEFVSDDEVRYFLQSPVDSLSQGAEYIDLQQVDETTAPDSAENSVDNQVNSTTGGE